MKEESNTLKTIKDIASARCPSCRSESLFEYPIYRLDRMLKMHKTCPKCQQDFVQEPGFYFGAMYFSYAFSIAIMVFFGVGYSVFFHPETLWSLFAVVFIPVVLLSPFSYRLSRAMMLYLFGKIRKADSKIFQRES